MSSPLFHASRKWSGTNSYFLPTLIIITQEEVNYNPF